VAFLKPEQIEKLLDAVEQLERKHDQLVLTFNHRVYTSDKGAEYARNGYMRRVGSLRRCIENVYALIPPATDVIPDRSVLYDTQINIQAFVANVYGAIDNLAWIWVYERGLDTTIHRTRVGLRAKHTELRATFSDSFRAYLQKIDPWLEYQIEYRDALAHRIPLYIPPGSVKPKNVDAYNDLSRRMIEALYVKRNGFEYDRLSAEQEKLLIFDTVEEMGYNMLEELDKHAKPSV
jgi:hypothetical protein